MIGYLQGEVLENADGKILIGVGDKNSQGMVGYLVAVPQHSVYECFSAGKRVELFIHTHVREDAFDLYGFSSYSEKAFFLTLLTVNGIGPKSALAILAAAEWNQLIQAIMDEDQAFLTRLPGVGKKTAERMVVELRDAVKKKVDQGLFILAGKSKAPLHSIPSRPRLVESLVFREAREALLGLGYREQDVQQLLSRVTQETSFNKTEDLIKTALRQLTV